MTATLFPFPVFKAFKDGNLPLVGGKLYSYEAGSTTPKTTYQDLAGTTANTNPVILDANGEARVRLLGNYKLVLYDADDNLVWSEDNIESYLTDLGVTAAARTLLDDATISDMLTTLGFSAYIKTLLADSDATAALTTLGLMAGTKNLNLGGLKLGDGKIVYLGDDNDAALYHNGSNLVFDVATGQILIKTNGNYAMSASQNGEVQIYYNNALKLATTAAGVAVTGNLAVSGNVSRQSPHAL